MMVTTNPLLNERGETYEMYLARLEQERMKAQAQDEAAKIDQVVNPAYDPAIDALRQRLIQLEGIATKHYTENVSNRAQVRALVKQVESQERAVAKAKIYRQELKRIHAKHRLVILELRAMKERYDNLVRLSVANEDAARDQGYQTGYQTGHFDGFSEGFAEATAPPIDLVPNEQIEEFFDTAPFDLDEVVKSNN